MKKMSQEQFLQSANKNARTRTFDERSYESYCAAITEAKKAAKKHLPYFAEVSAGGVANKYGSMTTSARWCVYTAPDGQIVQVVDRVAIGGRHVSSVFHGGKQAYEKWFRELPHRVIACLERSPHLAENLASDYHRCCACGSVSGWYPEV